VSVKKNLAAKQIEKERGTERDRRDQLSLARRFKLRRRVKSAAQRYPLDLAAQLRKMTEKEVGGER
jgi:hypothetical protein